MANEFLSGLQVGANLAYNAERIRQQREETRMQAVQMMQQMQAARALDEYRKAQEERLRRQFEAKDAESEREALRQGRLEEWQTAAAQRLMPEAEGVARRDVLGGGPGPLTEAQVAQGRPEAFGSIMQEGAIQFPKEYGSLAGQQMRGETSMDMLLKRLESAETIAANALAAKKTWETERNELTREVAELRAKTAEKGMQSREEIAEKQTEARRVARSGMLTETQEKELAPFKTRLDAAVKSYNELKTMNVGEERLTEALIAMQEADLAYRKKLASFEKQESQQSETTGGTPTMTVPETVKVRRRS